MPKKSFLTFLLKLLEISEKMDKKYKAYILKCMTGGGYE